MFVLHSFSLRSKKSRHSDRMHHLRNRRVGRHEKSKPFLEMVILQTSSVIRLLRVHVTPPRPTVREHGSIDKGNRFLNPKLQFHFNSTINYFVVFTFCQTNCPELKDFLFTVTSNTGKLQICLLKKLKQENVFDAS